MFMRVRQRFSHPGGRNPMGEGLSGAYQLSFNPSIRVAFQGSTVTSDGGLVLVRELDERLGFGDWSPNA